ncbi:YjfB family protein [Hydrogenovibrio marinus]|uniref:Motility protein n=1 Tax=Hydrogenovibrio marinus TaxID=28885 RepID=A0A066ZQ98_HYDMR|nr:YjfB family protein [Hydrogenovibrio marinus]KDN95988.1 hypothetical protein EI16_06790 [Hydrogenovibrio marinus]BBN58519.1 hypothetical protein HVMH_0113 [Hydrogenovibrio marinus]
MDISPNQAVSMAVTMQQAQTPQAVQISMLKKSMDIQSQGALALLESLPSATPSTQGLPPNLGNNINTTA